MVAVKPVFLAASAAALIVGVLPAVPVPVGVIAVLDGVVKEPLHAGLMPRIIIGTVGLGEMLEKVSGTENNAAHTQFGGCQPVSTEYSRTTNDSE